MRIAIIGATGGSGRHFLELATTRGHEVVAMARDPLKLKDAPRSIKVAKADVRDPRSLSSVLEEDFDAVVSIVGASGLREARRVTDLYSAGTGHLIEAMLQSRNRRLLVVSSAGVEAQPNDGWFYTHILKRYFLEPMYQDMRRMELAVTSSALDWTIVRPPYLTSGAPTGRYRISENANFPDDKSLRRGDLAHFLLGAAESKTDYRRSIVRLSE